LPAISRSSGEIAILNWQSALTFIKMVKLPSALWTTHQVYTLYTDSKQCTKDGTNRACPETLTSHAIATLDVLTREQEPPFLDERSLMEWN
jgi:hypothetical protein